MTVRRLLDEADSAELSRWMVLYKVEAAEAEAERAKQKAGG